MFWNKEPPSSRPPGALRESDEGQSIILEPTATSVSDDETEALETLAAVLRTLGRHAFDLDDVTCEESAEAFERWATRLLIGEVPTPGVTSTHTRLQGIRRDWGGLKRFTEQHRQAEHNYVIAGMANLRQALRVFIQCTTGNFRAERQAELLYCAELDDLGRALAVNDHAQIRVAAEKTAATLHLQMEARRSREQRQIALLHDSMEKLRHELNQMRHAAKLDGLTKLFNRTALDEHLELAADQTFLTASEACIVMVDIDHFKGINDNFGHPTGDEVLRQVAEELVRGFFRREDFVARYGGEEFCIVAEHTTFETTQERAERLRQAVENLAIVAFGKTLRVSVSFGIAALQYGETATSWIQRADEALYRAKRKGRNCISIAPPQGEALGGLGAPLGATLDIRAVESPRIIPIQETSPRINSPTTNTVHDQRVDPMRSTKKKAHSTTPQGNVTGTESRDGSLSTRKEGSRRKVGPTRPLGHAKPKDPATPTKSPISALLGPTSRR